MALPQTVRVKLSSEDAGSISITPVVVQEFALRELVEHVLAITAKDEARIREILLRGTMVSGASRFRWQGWDADPGELRDLLAVFPDPDPSLAFDARRCTRAVLLGSRETIEIPKEAAAGKGLLQRTSFWDVLMAVIGSAVYAGYSYRERADRYTRRLTPEEAGRLRDAAAAVRFTTLRDRIRASRFDSLELYTPR